MRDLYVDDNISGSQDIDEGLDFYLFIKTLMLQGSFELRKWHSSSDKLSDYIQEYEKLYFGNTEIHTNTENMKETTKILGITWNKKVDKLIFNIKDLICEALRNDVVTKREVLKTVSSIYDPLGTMSFAVINLKLFFQEVCSLKCDWDAPLSSEFNTRWKQCLTSLMGTEEISQPRHYLEMFDVKNVTKIELHGFSDASERAYAVVFLRFILRDSEIRTQFVASKTKVVPLKKNGQKSTIPRLELMACLILSKLVKVISNSLHGVYDVSRQLFLDHQFR